MAVPTSAPRIPELDGVRGLAILLVLVGHLFNHLLPEGGGFGVSLFFALSGYLITTVLIIEHRSKGTISLKHFYIRRARRLLPALTIFLFAFASWALLEGWSIKRVTHSTLPVFFYSANWSGAVGWGVGHHMDHTWSLSVEEQFYIGWPVFMLLISRLRLPWLTALGLGILVVLIRYATVYAFKLPADPIYTLLRYDEILLGCALALGGFRLPAWVGYLALSLLLALAAVRGVRLAGNHAGYLLISVVTTALVGSATELRWLFNIRLLRHLGRISYSVYLWHFPIWVITSNPWLTLFLTFLIAELSWRLVEEPILSGKRLRWLTAGSGGAASAPMSPALPDPAKDRHH